MAAASKVLFARSVLGTTDEFEYPSPMLMLRAPPVAGSKTRAEADGESI